MVPHTLLHLLLYMTGDYLINILQGSLDLGLSTVEGSGLCLDVGLECMEVILHHLSSPELFDSEAVI